jgi:hypothetical protein
MGEILFRYERLDPTSWIYLSSLLTIALYVKFGRLWSIRNLDLIGLIFLAPGLLLVKYGADLAPFDTQASLIGHVGHIWLIVVSALFLVRLLLDTSMVRRPLLEPNLSVGGMTFLGISLLVFLMANVITGRPGVHDLAGSKRAAELSSLEASPAEINTLKTHGPGFPLLYLLPHISTEKLLKEAGTDEGDAVADLQQPAQMVHAVTARVVAILSQIMIVLGMALIGLRHFDNIKTGIAAATLYMLLPYTAMWTGSVTHALPGALLVWAIVAYRRPLIAGMMLGLAFGTIYYPLFLLPLWMSFYWRRGLVRFLSGAVAMVALLVVTLAITSVDAAMFFARLQQMFGARFPIGEDVVGIWKYWNDVYRYPILAGFIFLSLAFAIWPAQKNLGTLMSGSAALMLGTQFWHAHSGGLALAWYLPLLLMTIFRPNLEDRVALSVLGGRGPRGRRRGNVVVRAA